MTNITKGEVDRLIGICPVRAGADDWALSRDLSVDLDVSKNQRHPKKILEPNKCELNLLLAKGNVRLEANHVNTPN